MTHFCKKMFALLCYVHPQVGYPFIYLGSFKFLLLELNIAFPVKLLCAPRYIAKTRFTDSVFTNWK